MFKYIKLLSQWKDVRKVWQEEKGTGKPWWVSRRFYGVVISAVGYASMAFIGVTISPDSQGAIADNLTIIGGAVSAAIALYGHITTIVGAIKRSKAEDAGK